MKTNICLAVLVVFITTIFSPAIAQQPELVVQTGHTDNVNTVAFSPDGKLLASGGKDRAVILWDVKSGKRIRTLTGFSDEIKTLLFIPESKFFVCSSRRETKLWDMATMEEVKGLSRLDAKTKKVIQVLEGLPRDVKFSPDLKMLALVTTGGDSVQVWDLKSGKPLWTSDRLKDKITSIAFNPDNTFLAGGVESKDGTIMFLDAATGNELKTFTTGGTSPIKSIEFSRDGKVLLLAGRAVIRLWDVENARETKSLRDRNRTTLNFVDVNAISLSPDGTVLASANSDKAIRLWEFDVIRARTTFLPKPNTILEGYTNPIQQIALSADGKLLATAHGRGGMLGSEKESVRLWDLAAGQAMKTFSGHSSTVLCVAFSPNGMLLASASMDRVIKIWDILTGEQLQTLNAERTVYSVAFSLDGKRLASGDGNKYLKLWDTDTWQESKSIQHEDAVVAIAYSPDGNIFATGVGTNIGVVPFAKNRDIQLWDAMTGEEIRSLKEPGRGERLLDYKPDAHSLAFSPDGKILAAGCSDKTIKLWDVATGEFLTSFEGHADEVRSIAFSPDGKMIASSSGRHEEGGIDFNVKLWELRTGKELKTFSGHSNEVSSVVFSPDGKFLISGSMDGRTKIWDVLTGKELITLIALGKEDWIAVTPDGHFDGSAEGMKLIHYVQNNQIIPLNNLFEKFHTPKLLTRILY
ncbi:MAG: WD40 repeat domain-containing protein [bacterium]